jgi:uncharacterized protein (TIGR02145 family)
MKQFYLVVTLILVFNSHHLIAQNDSIYFWKGGIKINQLSIKTVDLDSITFKRPSPTFAPLPSVTIGTQVWTVKNLDVVTYSDGTLIPEVQDGTDWQDLTTGAWCYYKNDPANGAIYGKLYNWYAVAGIWNEASKTDPSQRKKLAPTGWHVPLWAEWTKLTDYLGGSSVAANKMKEMGNEHWTSYYPANNTSGFTALPGGWRTDPRAGQEGFDQIGESGCWWSSAKPNTPDAFLFILQTDYSSFGWPNNTFGSSVRCLRD